MGHDTDDPYLELAAAIIKQAQADLLAPEPPNPQSKAHQDWRRQRESARLFFEESGGFFEIFCECVGVDVGAGRQAVFKRLGLIPAA